MMCNSNNKLPRQKPRTCVACRSEAPKRVLLRIVRKPNGTGLDGAIVDPTGKLPGRGAYICANPDCLEKARKTGALARALKLKSLPDECYSDLARCIEDYAKKFGPANHDNNHYNAQASENNAVRTRELKSLIGLSRRAGLVKIGTDAIDRALRHEPLLILTARDCSESVTRFAEKSTGKSTGHDHDNHNARDNHEDHDNSSFIIHHSSFTLPLTIDELSTALGAGKVQIIAMSLKGGLADKIKILLA